MSESDYTPPKPSTGDKAHTLVRAGLQAVPIVGGPTAELLGEIVQPPLQKRLHEWRQRVGEGLESIEQKLGVDLEKLRENDNFIDAAMQASQAAIQTNQKDKHWALRNALLNSALPGQPDASRQAMFIGMVERFTEWHLR